MSNIKFRFISGDVENSFKKKEEEYQDRINTEKQRRSGRSYGSDDFVGVGSGVGIRSDGVWFPGVSGHSGISGYSGYSGYSGIMGMSGYSGSSGYSGLARFSSTNDNVGIGISTNSNVGISTYFSAYRQIDLPSRLDITSRTELTVLPADTSQRTIGWTVHENIGIAVHNIRSSWFRRLVEISRRLLTRSRDITVIVYEAIRNDATMAEIHRQILERRNTQYLNDN